MRNRVLVLNRFVRMLMGMFTLFIGMIMVMVCIFCMRVAVRYLLMKMSMICLVTGHRWVSLLASKVLFKLLCYALDTTILKIIALTEKMSRKNCILLSYFGDITE